LSPELIGLLSEQLYRSPSKAIEELVINAFDAEADEARIFVAEPGDKRPFIAVYDDGVGMSYEGLADLWKVGRPKPRDETLFKRKQRRQIGKFGIGKLSTYAVANRVTYITKADTENLAVTIDYGRATLRAAGGAGLMCSLLVPPLTGWLSVRAGFWKPRWDPYLLFGAWAVLIMALFAPPG